MGTHADPSTALANSTRVLVLTPQGRDAELTCELLSGEQLSSLRCSTMEQLCAALEEGAGVVIVTEEAIESPWRAALQRFMDGQPPWSDMPLIIFGDPHQRADKSRDFTKLGNVTFIERPVGVREMVAAVRSGLRARARQYEARRAIESRDQFLAMLGHELRNPLGAIHLAVQMETPEPGTPPRRHIRVIERQARHLARLVDDLLDVSRVTSGKVVLQEARVDLNEVVRACVQTLGHEANAAGLGVTLRCSSEPLIVLGDAVRLEQIFSNLVTNAIKYTPRGGTIELELSRLGDSAIVRVTDSGVGIDAEMLPLVFDMFAQADRSLDRAKGGMGLGLTLVQNLVRLHRGEVTVHSDGLGKGSAFHVRLPSVSVPAAGEVKPEQAARGPAPLRVVLVEDNEDIREMFEELLVARRHRVTTASDGPNGVARILAETPDIAFVDLGLPGFDGFEVARRVRSQCGKHVRLVAVTGYGQPEDRARALEAGFDRQLTKPVDIRDVEDALLGASRSA